MCGIVAYLGRKDAAEILINGLRRLEYRGYDSAGLATLGNGGVELRRAVGRVSELSAHLERESVHGTVGIAHTRWATHGRPTVTNAHPHLDQSGRIALVHNGVIENHAALREFLAGQGVTFRSQTDSESLAQLIGFLYRQSGDFLDKPRNLAKSVTVE
jgi:glutamine---fructose-6-phosphate transaminase (isomerizing)